MRHPLFSALAVASLGLTATALLPHSAPPGLSLEELAAVEAQITAVAPRCIEATVGLEFPPGSGAGGGSGVIVSESGWVLTAAHCIPRPGISLKVLLADGREYEAITRGKEARRDFGLIQILDEGHWSWAEIGDSDALQQDQAVLVAGHPDGIKEGRPPVLRLGIFEGRQRGFLRTTGIIEPGDSGGPVFDLDGRVIGINSQIEVSVAQNLHVPVNRFRENWDRLEAGESWVDRSGGGGDGAAPPPRVRLGIRARGNGSAVEVTAVQSDTAAAAAGLRAGDRIIGIGGVRVRTKSDLLTHLRELDPGDQIELEIRRDGSDRLFVLQIPAEEQS